MPSLRSLPSVERLLQSQLAAELIASYGRPLTLDAIRRVLEDVRRKAAKGGDISIPTRDTLLDEAHNLLHQWTSPTLVSVINASGVILHTNLGRAPLSTAANQFIDAITRGYTNLEYDLETGQRGSRLVHAEALLKQLLGAESAVVVNNNAAAILLALSALSNRKRVIIARSQLVEIGDGFRLLDVMKQSGARLVEIGATNRIHLEDYEVALAEPAALVVHAHRSNFKITGFTSEPELGEVIKLAHQYAVPVMDDLGSGTLLPTERYGLSHEPMVQESLALGADLVCFSGDKLLGGPQAGIILGKKALLEKIRKHPLARAVRADKLCLAALTATLQHYLRSEVENEIPIWRMISTTPEQLKARAKSWLLELGQGEVVPGESAVGGGSLPGETLPTFLLSLHVKSPVKFLQKLRQQQPPIIARTEDDQILLDPRTVLPEQEGAFLVGMKNALGKKI